MFYYQVTVPTPTPNPRFKSFMKTIFFFSHVQYKLSNVLFSIFIIVLCSLGLYILWRWCKHKEKEEFTKKRKAGIEEPESETDTSDPEAVYAHEIEPGIIVLQSEDGEYFKIVKECDSNKAKAYGSFQRPVTKSERSGFVQCHDSGNYLTPPSTSIPMRAHVFPKVATAPPLPSLYQPPPPYEPPRPDLGANRQ